MPWSLVGVGTAVNAFVVVVGVIVVGEVVVGFWIIGSGV